MTSLHDELLKEYCPPLDPALVSAILLDFPTPSADAERSIRETLSLIAADAKQQEDAEQSQVNAARSVTEPSTAEVENALEAWHLDTQSRSDDGLSSQTSKPGSDDPLTFLESVFPKIQRDSLKARLDAGDADVEALVEELLSEELIASMVTHAYPGEGALEPTTSDRRKEKKRQKAVMKASKTIALNDVLHRASSPAPPPSPKPAPRQAPTRETNRWATLDSTASYLATLMHISPGRMSSAYHAADSSLPIAVHTVMLSLARERPFSDIPNHDVLLSDLRNILPMSEDDLRMLLSATDGDLSDAMDLHEKLRDIEAEHGNLLQNGYFGFGKEDGKGRVAVLQSDSTLNPIIPTAHIEPTYKGWKRLEDDSSDRESSLSASALVDEPKENGKYTAAECAAFAQMYLQKRNEAFRAAARHYNRGGTSSKMMGERGAAFHYADVGRQMDRKRKEWELRAARNTVRERSVTHGNVDLHNLTLSHALTVVKESCNEWYSSGQKEPLTIITGVGRHSTNQNAVLRPAVAKLLDREGWRWQWERGDKDSGSIVVTGTTAAKR